MNLAIKEWVEWWVKFLMVGYWARLCRAFPDYANFEVERSQCVDELGVLNLPLLDHSEVELLDLKDDEECRRALRRVRKRKSEIAVS
jgi:hypothetical protein